MKKLIIVLILFLTPLGLNAEEITFVKLSEDPWPPFTYGDYDGSIPTGGYAVEFTKEIFNKLKIDYEILLYPWKRCLNQMRTGERDGVILSGFNEEREEYMVFTEPIMTGI